VVYFVGCSSGLTLHSSKDYVGSVTKVSPAIISGGTVSEVSLDPFMHFPECYLPTAQNYSQIFTYLPVMTTFISERYIMPAVKTALFNNLRINHLQ
jgi:hypothetical protein